MNIGLGVMGVAELLVEAGLPYGSDGARVILGQSLSIIQSAAKEESMKLAEWRGTFPLYPGSVWEQINEPVRNAALTSIAPTGTLSTLLDVSGGIEPIFAVAFTRTTNEGHVLKYIHPKFVEIAKQEGFFTKELVEKIIERGSVLDVEEVPPKWKEVFRGAHEIHWRDHLLMQAGAQKHVHSGVSKTVNLPSSASIEDVMEIYAEAWRLGCKGVTVFRDGCRGEQVLTTTSGREKKGFYMSGRKVQGEWGNLLPIKLPDDAPARRFYVETPVGELQLTIVTDDEDKPVEVFGQVGHAGSDINADVEAICRMTSVALRSGTPLWYVVKQLMGIGGRSSIGFGGNRVRSLPDAIGQVMNKHFLGVENEQTVQSGDCHLDICPECGSAALVHESGCDHCQVCNYSKC